MTDKFWDTIIKTSMAVITVCASFLLISYTELIQTAGHLYLVAFGAGFLVRGIIAIRIPPSHLLSQD